MCKISKKTAERLLRYGGVMLDGIDEEQNNKYKHVAVLMDVVDAEDGSCAR